MLRKFHAVSPDGFPEDPDKDARYKREVFSKDQLSEEINKMEKALKDEADKSGKVVFCHNDALLGNIVIGDGNQVSFIGKTKINFKEAIQL